jgi:hypothetical protein
VVAELSHRLGFAGDTGSVGSIQFFRLDESKGDISIKYGVMGEVDLLLATLPKELLHLITTVDK